MRMVDIIAKKRDGGILTKAEIDFFVSGVSDHSLSDEQIAALLMAIRIRDMNPRETADLSLAMANSGTIADLSAIEGIKVDKHSTGGVGDTTTLICQPLAAACGVPVVKMSGRSLGHTGGTLDKLWSVPGMRTDLSIEEIRTQAQKIGCVLGGQTGDLAPADKKLYALRDVTATVDSLPLIASSILSKKIAAGCDAIVLDVKTGSGAFMEKEEDAKELASAMVSIGKHAGRKMLAVVSDMNQPLGSHVGNALEVREAILVLQNKISGPLCDLACLLASHMVLLGGGANTIEEATQKVHHALISGLGLAKMREWFEAQGGNGQVTQDPSLLPTASIIHPVPAQQNGYISRVQCAQIGIAAQLLGAGRLKKEDSIDPSVGLIMHVRVGDSITVGQPLATLHANDPKLIPQAQEALAQAIHIGNAAVSPYPLIYDIIGQ